MTHSENTGRPRTIQVSNEKCWVHDRSPFTPWKALVKVDGNEKAYIPAYRTGVAQGSDVEIFSLLPVDGCGDTILIQIRIYTKADFNKYRESVPYSAITTQCNIPAIIHLEPEKQRILITLLCRLEARPQESRLMVEPDPEIGVEFLQEDVEEEREELATHSAFSMLESHYNIQRDQQAAQRTVEEWMELGKQAYKERAYKESRDYFDLAARIDLTNVAQATIWLALSCLQDHQIEVAEEELMLIQDEANDDSESVTMRVLGFWCQMCQYPTRADLLQSARTLLLLASKGDPLDVLENRSKQWRSTPERMIFDAMLAYLRDKPELCLQLLSGLSEDERHSLWNRWLVTFWEAMAHATLGRSDLAQDAIREVVADGMPQVLLLPFRWFKNTNPSYFTDL